MKLHILTRSRWADWRPIWTPGCSKTNGAPFSGLYAAGEAAGFGGGGVHGYRSLEEHIPGRLHILRAGREFEVADIA